MKKTKRDFYNEIMAIEGVSAEIKDFCASEIALLDKKNANRKPTKAQEANEGYKAEIIDILKAQNGSALTVSEIRKASSVLTNAGEVQKISALVKQLVDAHEVVKTVDGKKSLFSIPVVEETADEGEETVDEGEETTPEPDTDTE